MSSTSRLCFWKKPCSMATGTGARQTAPAFQDSFSLRGAPVSAGASEAVRHSGNSEKSIAGRDRPRRKGLRAKRTERRGESRRSSRLEQSVGRVQSAALVFVVHQSPLLRWHGSAIRAAASRCACSVRSCVERNLFAGACPRRR